MKQGTAKLTDQDEKAVNSIIEQMESQILDLRRLITDGYKSEAGISSTVSSIYEKMTPGHSYLPTTYRPIASLKSERWDKDGNSASVSGGDVKTAEEHLDAILVELLDGTYPGFVSTKVLPRVECCTKIACYNQRNGRECWKSFHADGTITCGWESREQATEVSLGSSQFYSNSCSTC